MCGIVGLVSLEGEIIQADRARLQAALEAQTHRGPDSRSAWVQANVAFGHNRLSIIDLSTAANQPFHREDLGMTVVFNGEIYNYQSLKEQLIGVGYQFCTASDTEVLIAAYRHYQEQVVEHLVGMFAFVIYDHRSGEIFAARDRFGEKPIFFIHDKDAFYFASELRALKILYPGELQINQDAVVDLLENLYINQHHSVYREVGVFPAAHWLTIKKGKLNWQNYYSYPKQVTQNPGFEPLKRQVKDLLVEIVAKELHADVPVATFLSSGIDSSVITAIAKEHRPDILAVTMSTGDPNSDEAEAAKDFAKKLDIRQEVVTVDPGSLNILAKLLRNIQPLADASLIPTHLVTEAVASHTKVMLSGDGGDEVFGSYNKPNLFKQYGGSKIPGGNALISSFMEMSNSKWEKYLSDKNRIKLGGWKGYYRKSNLSGRFGQVFLKGSPQNRVWNIASSLISAYSANPEKLSFGVDIESRLPGDFLLKVDTASMRSSLEVRAPFLDHRLVDLSLSCDLESVMPSQIDKELTRSIYRDYVGHEHQGSKKGFTIPYLQYLKGAWGDILEKFLKEGLSAQYFHFNTQGLLDMLAELRMSPRQSLARVLFSALVMEIWLRVFHLDQELEFSIKAK